MFLKEVAKAGTIGFFGTTATKHTMRTCDTLLMVGTSLSNLIAGSVKRNIAIGFLPLFSSRRVAVGA